MVINISFIIWLLTWIGLSALASFRIAELLVIDDGPFEIFVYFRGWANSSNPILKNTGQVLNCVHCTGIYVSATFTMLYFFPNTYTLAVLIFFAVAGLQSIIARKLGRVG